MTEEKNQNQLDFEKLLDENPIQIPKAGDVVKGTVLAASNAEVRLDIDGIRTGIVRGKELFPEAEEYSSLKPGDEVEATVMEEENEKGELELSFRYAGEEKAWNNLLEAYKNRDIIKVRITAVNKGGLMASFRQIGGFIPVSQLSPENYPRVEGGDKAKILNRLKKFIGEDFEVKVITINEKEDKVIFSEKEAWMEKRKDVISKYKVGSVVEGEVTAVTDFGVFIKFGENLEGLIHISELAWQRIDNPSNLYKVGDVIKAEIVSMQDSKVFLSAKKLQKNPWEEASKKYQVGQIVKGRILKVNPFGLFVGLDEDIHGLAHINHLDLGPGQKINDVYKESEEKEFAIISIEPKEHRLGLAAPKKEGKKDKEDKEDKKEAKEKKSSKAKKDEEDKKDA